MNFLGMIMVLILYSFKLPNSMGSFFCCYKPLILLENLNIFCVGFRKGVVVKCVCCSSEGSVLLISQLSIFPGSGNLPSSHKAQNYL